MSEERRSYGKFGFKRNVFFYIMWRFPSFSAMLYSNQNLCLTLQVLNVNLYCNPERVCTVKVLAFRSGKVPTLNF